MRLGDNLSDREIEVLLCLTRAESNKEIGRKLGITDATVKMHVKALLSKLCLKNRTAAAIWAIDNGLREAAAE